jgi:hypothetical protein
MPIQPFSVNGWVSWAYAQLVNPNAAAVTIANATALITNNFFIF